MPRTTARVLLAALVAVVSLLGLAGPASAAAPTGPLTPVATDLTKYVGEWNQVAAIPAFFDVFCVKDTRASYVKNADGTVGVTNRCSGPFDFPISIQGTAKVNGPADGGNLQVSFVRLFGQTFYFGGTNYVVAAHDAGYTWALVGSPERGSGFLLSRTPALTTQQWATAYNALKDAGYDPCRFLTTPTTGGLSTKAPLCTAPVTTGS